MILVRRFLLAGILALSATLGGSPTTFSVHAAVAAERKVIFNYQTLKYHDPDCVWAHRCTRHCIAIPLSEAIKRGGIPCKVCGG